MFNPKMFSIIVLAIAGFMSLIGSTIMAKKGNEGGGIGFGILAFIIFCVMVGLANH